MHLAADNDPDRHRGLVMSINFTEEDAAFVKAEYQSFLSHYNYDAFLESCKSHCRRVAERHEEAGRAAAEEAIDALKTSRPLALIRVGDGEGNLLGFASRRQDDRELKWFNAAFYMQDHQILDLPSARRFSSDVARAIEGADIIGLRSFIPGIEDPRIRNTSYIPNTFQRGEIRGALGIIRALEYGKVAIQQSVYRNSLVVSAWIYIELLKHLDAIFEHAPRVIVITGRPELQPVFLRKLKTRLASFEVVPIHASEATSERPFHYPKRFAEIAELLRSDLRGALVLVGAGLFGKIYCATAKQSGAVALDLGSGFDILAGKLTRLIHHGNVNLEKSSWIKKPAI